MGELGGLHRFMSWNKNILTDSGGFQMVSLLKLAEITEEGVQFESPHDGTTLMMTPEERYWVSPCVSYQYFCVS